MSLLDYDGFDDYNGVGTSPGVDAAWTNSGAGAASLSAGRFGVGQRLTLGANGSGNRNKQRALGSSVSTFTIGGMINIVSVPGSALHATLALIMSGTYQCGWRFNNLGGIDVYRYSSASAGTLLGSTANGIITPDSEPNIETTFVINDATGSVTINLNGVQVLSLTNQDTKNHATLATADTFLIGFSSTTTGTATCDFDDLYWRDDSTMLGDVRVEQLLPNSDGATLNFTPSTGVNHYACVDEATVDTTDYLSGTSVGDLDLLGLTDLSNTPSSIYAVKSVVWALKTDAATRSVAAGVKSGATASDGANYALASTVQKSSRMMATDPNTSAAWTATAVNALQLQPKVTV